MRVKVKQMGALDFTFTTPDDAAGKTPAPVDLGPTWPVGRQTAADAGTAPDPDHPAPIGRPRIGIPGVGTIGTLRTGGDATIAPLAVPPGIAGAIEVQEERRDQIPGGLKTPGRNASGDGSVGPPSDRGFGDIGDISGNSYGSWVHGAAAAIGSTWPVRSFIEPIFRHLAPGVIKTPGPFLPEAAADIGKSEAMPIRVLAAGKRESGNAIRGFVVGAAVPEALHLTLDPYMPDWLSKLTAPTLTGDFVRGAIVADTKVLRFNPRVLKGYAATFLLDAGVNAISGAYDSLFSSSKHDYSGEVQSAGDATKAVTDAAKTDRSADSMNKAIDAWKKALDPKHPQDLWKQMVTFQNSEHPDPNDLVANNLRNTIFHTAQGEAQLDSGQRPDDHNTLLDSITPMAHLLSAKDYIAQARMWQNKIDGKNTHAPSTDPAVVAAETRIDDDLKKLYAPLADGEVSNRVNKLAELAKTRGDLMTKRASELGSALTADFLFAPESGPSHLDLEESPSSATHDTYKLDDQSRAKICRDLAMLNLGVVQSADGPGSASYVATQIGSNLTLARQFDKDHTADSEIIAIRNLANDLAKKRGFNITWSPDVAALSN
jgi:hypothetical protein